jgi:hypothetical protein
MRTFPILLLTAFSSRSDYDGYTGSLAANIHYYLSGWLYSALETTARRFSLTDYAVGYKAHLYVALFDLDSLAAFSSTNGSDYPLNNKPGIAHQNADPLPQCLANRPDNTLHYDM